MRRADFPLARRSLIAAGLGLGAGLAARRAVAQSADNTGSTAQAAAPAPLWTSEYWAKKKEVSLYLYRKRLGTPQAGERPLPVLFLVHGSSNSSRTSFDLTVPGRGEYSLMSVFARAGYDVWTMDHENYGRSSRTEGNSDIASGVEDLKPAVELVARETGVEKLNFCGVSSGALRAGGFAMAAPERVSRLVLAAFTYTGAGSPTLARRAERVEAYRASNRRLRDRAMIRSIFTPSAWRPTARAIAACATAP
jgi:pimeloyl-ACP methyl ester carboxylesterase